MGGYLISCTVSKLDQSGQPRVASARANITIASATYALPMTAVDALYSTVLPLTAADAETGLEVTSEVLYRNLVRLASGSL